MKARSFFVSLLLLALFAFFRTVLAQAPAVKTDKTVYSPGETITVQFEGLPGSQTDWITVTGSSEPDGVYGQWAYTKGAKSGTMTFRSASPGKYEVRLYFDYPRGGKIVQARFAFQVIGGLAQVPTQPAVPTTGPSSPSSNTLTASTSPQPAIFLRPNPLNVRVTTSTSVSATKRIGPEGGTIEVSGKNGTRFSLAIPKDALEAEQEIKLTPVDNIDGMPFSGRTLGAVQMSPEGLRFSNAAALTIESSNPAPPTGMVVAGFAYHGGGEEFHLYPSKVSANTVTFSIWHFSGVGAGNATQSDLDNQQQRIPSDTEDAINQGIADYLLKERIKAIKGEPTDPNLLERMADFMRAYYDLLNNDLPKATADCQASKNIIPKALTWARSVSILGLEDTFDYEVANIMDTMKEATANCYDKEFEACIAGNNPAAHHRQMLSYLRAATLLGIDGRLDAGKLNSCPAVLSNLYTGNITYTEVFDQSLSNSRPGISAGRQPSIGFTVNENIAETSTMKSVLRASVFVRPGQQGAQEATLSAFYTERSVFTEATTAKVACHVTGKHEPRIIGTVSVWKKAANKEGTYSGNAAVRINGRSINFVIPAFDATLEQSESSSPDPCGSGNEARKQSPSRTSTSRVSGRSVTFSIPFTILGSSDHLQGEKTETLGPRTYRYTWDLIRKKP